jgi:hypothetical protein
VGRRFVDMRTIQRRMDGKDFYRNRETHRREQEMRELQELERQKAGAELPAPDTIAKVLLGGDLAQLTPQQQISYYRAVCDSLGLNPLTKPFDYIRLSGRLVLYATRNATDQIRHRYGISVTITSREVVEDTYVVTARATLANGRHDESIGAVPIAQLRGENRSNAMMKCETKAKRRVTLSLVGLSTLDESEIDSIAGAQPAPLTHSLMPSPGPAPLTGDATHGGAEGGASVASANLNDAIPSSWKPFVTRDHIVGVIDQVAPGKRSGAMYVRLKETGEVAGTEHPDHIAQALAFQASGEAVVIVTEPHKKLTNEIISITAAADVPL